MNFIHKTAVIYPGVTLEDNVYIGAHCIIGAPAENKKTWGEFGKGVLIKSGTIINGLVTIDEGAERKTVIGEGCFIMKGCHIGHDAIIGNGVTMSPHVLIGGHSEVAFHTNMGMGSIVHQRCYVPSGCMIGMNSTVTKKSELKDDGVYVGSPVRFLRWNKRS